MKQTELYPLKFDPIYQYRIWGGRRLAGLLSKPLPENDPIGEAWILSDRADHPSKVTSGALKTCTINEVMVNYEEQLMGKLSGKFTRFPLLLKFLDCKQVLSVQVHPADDLKEYIPPGESGKTEAWVVLETGNESKIYAGLKQGTTKASLMASIDKHRVADDLASFTPKTGDGVLIKAGTVHTLSDVVVFEVQENSDVTYRLYDWDRIDPKTGKPRSLQVEQAIACVDFKETAICPVTAVIENDGPELREKLIDDAHFKLWRLTGSAAFMVGENAKPRILVCIEGAGELETHNDLYKLEKGEVMLIPAINGACPFVPKGTVVLLEIAIPDLVISH
jgi:mannose-6-phosphate isomerase